MKCIGSKAAPSSPPTSTLSLSSTGNALALIVTQSVPSKKYPLSLIQSYVEGSSYYGNFVADLMMFQDELAGMQADKSDDSRLRSKYYGAFGCAYREAGTFAEQEADGILGLGLQTNSRPDLNAGSANPPDIVQIQYMQGRIKDNLYSLCYGHDGGYMSLGNYDSSRHLPESMIETFTFDRSFGQFKIVLSQIKVNVFMI